MLEELGLRQDTDQVAFYAFFEERITDLVEVEGDADPDPRLTELRSLGLPPLETYIEMLYLLRQRFHARTEQKGVSRHQYHPAFGSAPDEVGRRNHRPGQWLLDQNVGARVNGSLCQDGVRAQGRSDDYCVDSGIEGIVERFQAGHRTNLTADHLVALGVAVNADHIVDWRQGHDVAEQFRSPVPEPDDGEPHRRSPCLLS